MSTMALVVYAVAQQVHREVAEQIAPHITKVAQIATRDQGLVETVNQVPK